MLTTLIALTHILVKNIASRKLMQYLLDTNKDSDSIINVNRFDAINLFLGVALKCVQAALSRHYPLYIVFILSCIHNI